MKKMYSQRILFLLDCRNPSTADGTWDPFDANEINYLHITSTHDEMKDGLLIDRLSFWKNMLVRSSDKLLRKESRDEL